MASMLKSGQVYRTAWLCLRLHSHSQRVVGVWEEWGLHGIHWWDMCLRSRSPNDQSIFYAWKQKKKADFDTLECPCCHFEPFSNINWRWRKKCIYLRTNHFARWMLASSTAVRSRGRSWLSTKLKHLSICHDCPNISFRKSMDKFGRDLAKDEQKGF